ncbi:MAG TPA: hypothetical protein VN651_12640 [Gemmatimonadaceae bacterium]|nr:hypothetical protein [Gemmatimonadaceae bacterium]
MNDQSELFDTRGVTDSAEHWDAVAVRVAREAMRRSRAGGVGSLAASRAGLIAASLLLAASLAFMTIASRQGSARPAVELRQALAPSDDVGRAIALTGRPPAVGALLFDEPRRGGGQP